MQIQIIDVNVVNKGKYNQAEVTYKDLDKGKTGSRNIMSFVNKDVYNVVTSASKNDVFDVQMKKNDKDFWEWTSVTAGTAGASKTTDTSTTKSFTSPKSTYETPEERAQRQVFIIRQSSIANAINLLKTEKKTPTTQEVLDVATAFTDYVLGNNVKAVPLAELPALDDDDLPD